MRFFARWSESENILFTIGGEAKQNLRNWKSFQAISRSSLNTKINDFQLHISRCARAIRRQMLLMSRYPSSPITEWLWC